MIKAVEVNGNVVPNIPSFFAPERVLNLREEHEQILRAELESVPIVNLLTFSEDTLGTALLPEEQRGLRAVKVSGDRNCLYNSASVLIKGDETLSGTLRVLTACELYFSAEFYANHAKISEAGGVSPYSEKNTLYFDTDVRRWQRTQKIHRMTRTHEQS